MDEKYYQQILKSAQKINPSNAFVVGCASFYKQRGFLTQKQCDALQRVRPDENKSSSYPNRYESYNYDLGELYEDMFGCEGFLT